MTRLQFACCSDISGTKRLLSLLSLRAGLLGLIDLRIACFGYRFANAMAIAGSHCMESLPYFIVGRPIRAVRMLLHMQVPDTDLPTMSR